MNWQSLFAGILSILMVLDCVLLVLLVLLQLPKKEAGAGLAFGGAATDALFGAGSGNVLTKITKYMAGGFFALALLLAIIGKPARQTSVMEQLAKPGAAAPGLPPSSSGMPATVPSAPATAPGSPAVTDLKPAPATPAKPAAEASSPAPSTNK
jgi:preprotein translocase subunit SecG